MKNLNYWWSCAEFLGITENEWLSRQIISKQSVKEQKGANQKSFPQYYNDSSRI